MLRVGVPSEWPETRPRSGLPVLVVAAVLLCSVWLVPAAPVTALLLLAAAGATVVFLRWPSLGPVAVIVGGQIIPFTVGTGTATELNAAVLLLAGLLVLWLGQMLTRPEARLVPSRPILPLLMLCAAASVSFLAGTRPWLPLAETASVWAQLGGLAIFFLSAGAFLLVGHQVRDLRWLQRLAIVFIVLGTAYLATVAVPELAPATTRVFQRGADSSVFWVWLAALAGGLALFNRSLPVPVRVGLAVVALSTVGVGFDLKRVWTSSWLPPAAALLVLVWMRSWRIGVILSVLVAVVMVANPELPASIVQAKEYSTDTRREAAEVLVQNVIPASPIIGLGPANYYWYTPLFPILGYRVRFNSHNNYIDIVAQTGLVGLVVFLWFMWEASCLAWRLRTRAPAGFGQAYAYAVLGGIGGTLVAAGLGDWVLPFVYNIGYQGFRGSVVGWLFLGGLLVVERLATSAPVRGVPPARSGT